MSMLQQSDHFRACDGWRTAWQTNLTKSTTGCFTNTY